MATATMHPVDADYLAMLATRVSDPEQRLALIDRLGDAARELASATEDHADVLIGQLEGNPDRMPTTADLDCAAERLQAARFELVEAERETVDYLAKAGDVG